LNKLGLWLASLRLVRSVLSNQCQCISSSMCNKVSRCLAIFTELGRRWNIGLMLRSTLPRIRATQLFPRLFLSCYRISKVLIIYECKRKLGNHVSAISTMRAESLPFLGSIATELTRTRFSYYQLNKEGLLSRRCDNALTSVDDAHPIVIEYPLSNVCV
jgi:hypothetical protein